MNLQQLEYIVAVDTYRHFVQAAEKCFVTQASLSQMIKKLELELGVKIFDRSKVPVIPTDIGIAIIEQAKLILKETNQLIELVAQQKETISGTLRLGIIPTLAPYLLPLFLPHFLGKYPQVKLHISELSTPTIIKKLEQQQLDAAIMATPLQIPSILERPLFYEQFAVFAATKNAVMSKQYLLPTDIDPNSLWLLEEGHCLRNQALNLCELKRTDNNSFHLDYEAGSIETLKKLVHINDGITIIPELALLHMPAQELNNVRHFKAPAPVREISLCTYRHFTKEGLITCLSQSIQDNLPPHIARIPLKKTRVVPILV